MSKVSDEMVDARKRLQEALDAFDADVSYHLTNESERADLWEDIEVNAGDLRQVLAALEAVSSIHEAEPDDANIADRILRQVRKFIAAEHKHARLLSSPETEMATSRDDVDMEHAALVGFTVSQVDQALRVVHRRRAHANPISKGVTVKALIGDSGPHDNGPSDGENDEPKLLWLSAADADSEHEVWFDPDEGGTPYLRADLASPPAINVEEIIDEVMLSERYAPKIIPMGANPPLFDGMQPDNDGPWVSRVDVAKLLRACLSHTAGEIEAGGEVERLRQLEAFDVRRLDHIKKLERRIHNQRASNRVTWEIVEMRNHWLGTKRSRESWARMAIRERASRARAEAADKRIAELTEALKPFVVLLDSYEQASVAYLRETQPDAAAGMTDAEIMATHTPDTVAATSDGAMRNPVVVTWGDFRLARTALSTHSGDKL